MLKVPVMERHNSCDRLISLNTEFSFITSSIFTFIKFESKSVCKSIGVAINENNLIFEINLEDKEEMIKCIYTFLEDITLVPESLSGFGGSTQMDDAYKMYLNFRVGFDAKINDCKQINKKEIQIYNVIADKAYNAKCANCNSNLNESIIIFNKVVNLPSSEWEEFQMDSFCHMHSIQELNCANVKNDANNLYLSDQGILLHKILLGKTSNDHGIIKCQRCFMILGKESKEEMLRIFENNITFESNDGTDCLDFDQNESIKPWQKLIKLIEKQLDETLSSKICLEAVTLGQCLLVWVMDTNLECFRHLTPLNPDTDTLKVTVTPSLQMKVLYAIAPSHSSQALSWKHDFAVDFHQMDDKSYWTIATGLLQSSSFLPPDHRTSDADENMMVGYLPILG